MAIKDITFKSIGKGVKTFFTGKDLTPEQKAEREKRKKEEQAYKQVISEKEKRAYQLAYQQELEKQRRLYTEQKEGQAIARAIVKAKQDVQTMGKPKPTFFQSFGQNVGKVTQALAKQGFGSEFEQKDFVKKAPFKSSTSWDIPLGTPSAKSNLKHLGTAKGGVNVDIDSSGNIVLARKNKLKNKLKPKNISRTKFSDMIWKL